MNENWKPGDVASVAMGHGQQVAIFTGEFWAWSDGSPGPYQGVSHCHRDVPARPLVVIDPEDREQVARLVQLFDREVDGQVRAIEVITSDIDDMGAALREFANLTPPKPEEPTGLGAVVVDTAGHRWVRAGKTITKDADDWRCIEGDEHVGWWSAWRDVKAVRVLSEGVAR